MYKKLLVIASCSLLFSCGENSSGTSVPEVSEIYELGQCTADREGEQAFVVKEDCSYKCEKGQWVSSVEKEESSSSVKSSSSVEDDEDVDEKDKDKDNEKDKDSEVSSAESSDGNDDDDDDEPSEKVERSSSSVKEMASSSSTPRHDDDDSHVAVIVNGEFTDPRDGYVYKTVQLGTRTWMAQNLNYAYNDGVQSSCYLDREDYCDILGRLYTWSGAMAVDVKYDSTYNIKLKSPHQGACPKGWHVSTQEDWEDLIDYIDVHNGNESVGWNLLSDKGWYFPGYYNHGDFTMNLFKYDKSITNKYGFNLMSGIYFQGAYSAYGDSSLTWVFSEDGLVFHMYFCSSWTHLGLNSCDTYDSGSYGSCYNEDGTPSEYLEKRAYINKNMRKPVRCVLDEYVDAPKIAIDVVPTAEGESEYSEEGNTLLDKRDGHVYKTTKIGKQIWMAENLNFKTEGGNADDLVGSACLENSPEMCETYGRMYSWNAAMDIPMEYESARLLKIELPRQGICPGGWHLPADSDWDELMNYIIADVGEDQLRESLMVPEASDGYEEEENLNSNKYGFSILVTNRGVGPGFYVELGGCVSDLYSGGFWVAGKDGGYARIPGDGYDYRYPTYLTHSKPVHGLSTYMAVRCVKD